MASRRRTAALCAVAAAALALAGCAAPPPIETVMGSWVGQPEAELVARLGLPARSHQNADGTRVLEYVRYWTEPRQYPCRVRFVASSDGIVERFTWEGVPVGLYGNSCRTTLGESAFDARHMHPSAAPAGPP